MNYLIIKLRGKNKVNKKSFKSATRLFHNNEGFTLLQIVVVIIVIVGLVVISARSGVFDVFGGLTHLNAIQDISELQSVIKVEDGPVSNAVEMKDANGMLFNIDAPPVSYLQTTTQKTMGGGTIVLDYTANSIKATSGGTIAYFHEEWGTAGKTYSATATVKGMSPNNEAGLPSLINASNEQVELDFFKTVLGLEKSQAYILSTTDTAKLALVKAINTAVVGDNPTFDTDSAPDRVLYLVQLDNNYITKTLGNRKTFDPKKYKVFYVEGVASRTHAIAKIKTALGGAGVTFTGSPDLDLLSSEIYDMINTSFSSKDVILIPYYDKDIIYDTNKAPLYKIQNKQ